MDAVRIPESGVNAERALISCYPYRHPGYEYRAIVGEVRGQWYYACYEVLGEEVTGLIVVDGRANKVADVTVLKAGGVWPYLGVVTTGRSFVLGLVAVAALVAFGPVYYRRPWPGPPLRPAAGRRTWWQRRNVAWSLIILCRSKSRRCTSGRVSVFIDEAAEDASA